MPFECNHLFSSVCVEYFLVSSFRPDIVLIFSFFFLLFLQILDFEPYNATADYFSFGVMVFEMATNFHPFLYKNESTLNVVSAILSRRPQLPPDMELNLKDLQTKVSIVYTKHYLG